MDNEFKVCVVHGGPGKDNYDSKVNNVVRTFTTDEKTFVKNNGDKPRLVFNLPVDGCLCDEDPLGDFCEAWVFDDPDKPTKIVVDMTVAKKIKMNIIRGIRNIGLQAWDGPHQISQWKGETKEFEDISQKKEALRNVPQEIAEDVANATSVDELLAIEPAALITNQHPDVFKLEYIPIERICEQEDSE